MLFVIKKSHLLTCLHSYCFLYVAILTSDEATETEYIVQIENEMPF